jgi:hypothetical protein
VVVEGRPRHVPDAGRVQQPPAVEVG